MILADTNAVLWLTTAPELLSRAAEDAFYERGRDGIAIAPTTLWEVAMAVNKRRYILDRPLQQYLQMIEGTFVLLPLTAAVALRAVQFTARFPKDPADRIIGATALAYELPLVTSDEKILASGEVPCIW